MNQRGGDEKGSPRATWWIGPVGVLLGFLIALVVILLLGLLMGFTSELAFLSLGAIPAISGYAFRALLHKTRRAAISSAGTAVGWVLFVGFLFSDPNSLGGLGYTLFIGAALFGLGGVVILGLVALGFILVSQGLASLAVRRLEARGPTR